MEDKLLLNEFSAKISKARNLYTNTETNCEKLKRELQQLQKDHALVKNQRESAGVMENSLRQQLNAMKEVYQGEN